NQEKNSILLWEINQLNDKYPDKDWHDPGSLTAYESDALNQTLNAFIQ
ncbi:hypothetical protein SMX93_003407, partial [Cronobacter turicensis]|nr:hypothetical protein [Cronobacter turicensis]